MNPPMEACWTIYGPNTNEASKLNVLKLLPPHFAPDFSEYEP